MSYSKEDVFSQRIVVVDFYMAKPLNNIDSNYSEFRGHEIKKVPIIRIFGSNLNGEKTCMHVHGVFPYFYIPYESSNMGDPEQLFYIIANSLDKAINISLGQTSSDNQHVFKIQLVKGIPFYGYHRKEHQFLKIYLYNPRFIRKAAHLLQNGAILQKNFQSHESHVPYILQFFIDYNLYGMSFLHIPLKVIKYRVNENDKECVLENLEKSQVFSEKVLRVSTSRHEIDIAASFILNRFQLMNKNSKFANPGIDSIWEDERIRRSKSDVEMPEMEIPPSDPRLNAKETQSDLFFKNYLSKKLEEMELNSTIDSESTFVAISDQTIGDARKKSKYDLKSILGNTVYPEVCSQDSDKLMNASTIQDHHSSDNAFNVSLKKSQSDHHSSDGKNIFEDNSVDEELVLSLSQNQHEQTLQDEDFDLLAVMEQLEGGDNCIDPDSTLAPLSQNSNLSTKTKDDESQKILNATICGDKDIITFDSEDDDLFNYTMTMNDIEGIENNQVVENDSTMKKIGTIPQLDGSDNIIPKTCRSSLRKKNHTGVNLNNAVKSPNKLKDSVKVTKSCKVRLKKLPSIEIKKFQSSNDVNNSNLVQFSSNVINKICDEQENKFLYENKNLSKVEVLPKFIDSCAEPSHLTISNMNIEALKFDDVENALSCESTANSEREKAKCDDTWLPEDISSIIAKEFFFQKNVRPPNNDLERYSLCNSFEPTTFEKSKENKSNKVSTQENSQENNKPGPSGIGNNKNINSLKSPSDFEHFPKDFSNLSGSSTNDSETPNEFSSCWPLPNQENNKRHSISTNKVFRRELQNSSTCTTQSYIKEKHLKTPHKNETILTEPVDNFKIDQQISPNTFGLNEEFSFDNVSLDSSVVELELDEILSRRIVISPIEIPPTFDEVKARLIEFEIPEVVYTKPFYGNSGDLTGRKEIGNLALSIPGNSLNDVEDFISLIPNLRGLNAWRQSMFEKIAGTKESVKDMITNSKLKEYFSTQRRVVISTLSLPPTAHDCKVWLKAREMCLKKNEKVLMPGDIEEESPIKIKREKVKLMLADEECKSDSDSSVVNCSIELSPLTPINLQRRIKREPSSSKHNDTILSTIHRKIGSRNSSVTTTISKTPISVFHRRMGTNLKSGGSTPRSATHRKIRKRRLKAQLSLITKLSKIDLDKLDRETSPKLETDTSENLTKLESAEEIVSSGSTAVSSETLNSENESVLRNLEKSSYVKNLNLEGMACELNSSFGLSGTTLNNTYGFKMNLENFQTAKADIQFNYLTVLVVEAFVPTRQDFLPNPEFDPIICLFYSVLNDVPEDHALPQNITGYIVVNIDSLDTNAMLLANCVNSKITVVDSEPDLVNELVDLCRYWDPDIFAGYEIEMASWGYVIERSQVIGIDIRQLLSRVPTQKVQMQVDEEKEQFTDLDIELKLCGRILLDVWRLMRSEIALTSYTFENVVYHILHKRCPSHSHRDLTKWYNAGVTRWIVIEYYLERVKGVLALLDHLDLIGRTSEMAKLMGIQFYEVLSRGSQYRVESMMLRVAKPRNMVPISPSPQQRAYMKAPEYLPLILEPYSKMYTDPLIVLDFQSLYPSVMIAYNYCFSTCLGRVGHLGQSQPFEFGSSLLRISPTELKKLMKHGLFTCSPCGAAFVKASVREGVLPRMLQEILDTRLMVKQSMKLHKNKVALQKILHSRQLALKLIANVTYGYTAANFSGRMACVEVADSVVAKGRETLERAIKMVQTTEKWRAEVVYGDTDSLFVLVRGRSREDAFRIGAEIAEAVTNDNPQPVKLKLEKVYQPSILQTKKRYVGFMYESVDQNEPIYEAKGIETVRRDGCPAVAKMLEKTLRILFETRDVSEVKRYVCRQFTKLLSGNANPQDLIFAKEFRGRSGYKPGACVPALELTKKWVHVDPRKIPRRGERVPFLIVNGPPGVPLIRLVRSPHEFLADDGLKINAVYYITKAIIPPLNRCLHLIGADTYEWFAALPRKSVCVPQLSTAGEIINYNFAKKSTISQYFSSTNCIIDCGKQTTTGICSNCKNDPQKCVAVISNKIAQFERFFFLTEKICQSCCGRPSEINCRSLECPVLFVLKSKERKMHEKVLLRNLIEENFQ